MLRKECREMLAEKDIIFELFAAAGRKKAEIGSENVFDFSLGNPSVAPPARINEAIEELLAEEKGSSLHGYSPAGGIPWVRESISSYLAESCKVPYKAEHIFMCCGAAAAIAHALRAVSNPGDEILSFAPYFPEYKPYVTGAGCSLKIVPADLKSFQIDFEKTEKMINERTAALLINSPNNPSGAVYSEATLRTLGELLLKKSREYGHTIYLISDEPYRDIVFSGTEAPYAASIYPHTLTCYSYSKSLSLPGERIGYLAVSPDCHNAAEICAILPQISRLTGHNGAPALWQMIAGRCTGITCDMSIYEANRDILNAALTDYGYECMLPGGTFYMFPKSPLPDSNEFCRLALEHNLVIVPGDSFGCPGYFRIAYCTPKETALRSLPVFKELYDISMNIKI